MPLQLPALSPRPAPRGGWDSPDYTYAATFNRLTPLMVVDGTPTYMLGANPDRIGLMMWPASDAVQLWFSPTQDFARSNLLFWNNGVEVTGSPNWTFRDMGRAITFQWYFRQTGGSTAPVALEWIRR